MSAAPLIGRILAAHLSRIGGRSLAVAAIESAPTKNIDRQTDRKRNERQHRHEILSEELEQSHEYDPVQ